MASKEVGVNARERLTEEFKAWKVKHPKGFFAEPCRGEDGTLDMLNWKCGYKFYKSQMQLNKNKEKAN